MKITAFGEKNSAKAVMCLGAFDSIHLGHKKIIKRALELEKEVGGHTCVLTYYNDLSALTSKTEGLVFTFEERVKRLENLGVNEICACTFTKEFSNQSPDEFLSKIADNRPIGAFICGNDFHFGKKAQGNVGYLKDYCDKKNIKLVICDFERDESGEKISTTKIKDYLADGNVEKANELLGDKYFVSGIVVKGRQMGRTIGFPTANIEIEKEKFSIKQGVYASTVFIKNKKYRGITNVGTAPTFSFNKIVTECYIDGYDGDLYGKPLTIYFDDFIRDIKQFSSVDELKEQLERDLQVIK